MQRRYKVLSTLVLANMLPATANAEVFAFNTNFNLVSYLGTQLVSDPGFVSGLVTARNVGTSNEAIFFEVTSVTATLRQDSGLVTEFRGDAFGSFQAYRPTMEGLFGGFGISSNPSFYLWFDFSAAGFRTDTFYGEAQGFRLTSVPEPTSWAMMTLGFGAMGFAMRRKKVSTRIRFA